MSLKRLLKSSGIYAIGNALNRVGGFLLLPLYTNYLSSAEYGGLELLYAMSAIVGSLLSVGIASATLRFYYDYDEQSDKNAVISTSLIASLLVSSVGSVIVWLATYPFFYKIFPPHVPAAALGILFVSMCLELSTEVLLAYVRARDFALLFVGVSIVKLLVQCAANIYFVRSTDLGMEGVLVGNLIAIGAEWVILAVLVIKNCGLAFHWQKFRALAHYCYPLLLSAMVAMVQGNFDRFYTGAVVGLSALGVYAVAQKFTRVLIDFIGVPFGLAYGSYRFEMMKLDDAPQIQGRLVLWLAGMLAALGLLMIYVLDDVLRIMTTAQYWPAAELMPVLVTGAIAYVLTGVMQTGILHAKKPVLTFYITLTGAVVGILLTVILAHYFNIEGVAVAVTITATLTMLLTGWKAHPFLPTRYPLKKVSMLLVFWVAFNALPTLLAWAGLAPALWLDIVLWIGFVACLAATGIIPVALWRMGLRAIGVAS